MINQQHPTNSVRSGSVEEYRFLAKLMQPIATDEVSPAAPVDHAPVEDAVSYSDDGTVKFVAQPCDEPA